MPGFVWPCATPKEDCRLGAKLQDTGKLPLNAPQPKWLADPTYQTKNRGKTIEEMLEAEKAPVDHLLDKHDFSGACCKRKMLTVEQKEKQQQYYCDVEKDAAFYKHLTGA
eukprot:13043784-Ditylum_brightwellii.AAC.1